MPSELNSFKLLLRTSGILFILSAVSVITSGNENLFPSDSASGEINCTPFDSLFPLLKDPKPGEWLYEHPEKEQDFEAYIRSDPRRPDHQKKIIYLQPIGKFDSVSLSIVDLVQKGFEACFSLEIKINPVLPDSLIPEKFRRVFENGEQFQTGFILEKILKPRLPDDAIALIAFTSVDLYPSRKWNYVFGQASVRHGIGVWSFARMADGLAKGKSNPDYLRRIFKTALHETLHLFSIPHCAKYNCLMNGSNSLEETDTKPLYLCPGCLSKLSWCLNTDPGTVLQKTARFWEEEKQTATAEFLIQCERILKNCTDAKK